MENKKIWLSLAKIIARRRAIHQLYMKLLQAIPGINVMDRPSEKYNANFWLTCITVDPAKAGFTREDLRLRLEAANIESRPLWKPMHLQPVFADAPFYGNGIAEKLFDEGLCLPSGPNLTDEDVERVVGNIRG